MHAKPRLIFFQIFYGNSLPEFLLIHMREHVACLRQSFDVTVISQDCDLNEICDRYEPDLLLFETGSNILTRDCRRPRVRNLHGNKSVPRAGFINADAWCETRAGTLSELHHWDVAAVFSICTTALEHTPALAHWPLFVWPNFIDPDVFKDYGQRKSVPVLLTGATTSQYPWRRAVYPMLVQAYEPEVSRHPGYLNRSSSSPLFGIEYAKAMNRAFFVPTCGTMARELVRKHLEIPAANACLLTERSPALDAAGFVDMKNCAFVDRSDVLAKVRHLLAQPDELAAITRAGHDLVHERHTLARRDQLAQWFRLSKELKTGERVFQRDVFEPLAITTDPQQGVACLSGQGHHLRLLALGDDKLRSRAYAKAKPFYREALGSMRSLPEARFRLALCDLGLGNARSAADQFFDLLFHTIGGYKAPDPDPVELAYFLIALVLHRRTSAAALYAKDFPWMKHVELDRARRLVYSVCQNRPYVEPSGATWRQSIHAMPALSEDDWIALVATWSEAAGRSPEIDLLPMGSGLRVRNRHPPGHGTLGRRIVLHRAQLKLRSVGGTWLASWRNFALRSSGRAGHPR